MFPGKQLVAKFATNNIVIQNWPEGIPLPPRPRKKGEKGPPEPRAFLRGVSGIPSGVQERLVEALCNTRYPLRFEVYKGNRTGMFMVLGDDALADLMATRSAEVQSACALWRSP